MVFITTVVLFLINEGSEIRIHLSTYFQMLSGYHLFTIKFADIEIQYYKIKNSKIIIIKLLNINIFYSIFWLCAARFFTHQPLLELAIRDYFRSNSHIRKDFMTDLVRQTKSLLIKSAVNLVRRTRSFVVPTNIKMKVLLISQSVSSSALDPLFSGRNPLIFM